MTERVISIVVEIFVFRSPISTVELGAPHVAECDTYVSTSAGYGTTSGGGC